MFVCLIRSVGQGPGANQSNGFCCVQGVFSADNNISIIRVFVRDIYYANTMVRGGGWSAGEKNKNLGVRKKIRRDRKKGGKLHEKWALKMYLFGL